ncbi:MAG TPA: deoxyribodipyrimidine photo-lyase, partial [Longilinea sp.]|nr:deoxyribodipyrimidine photo-lyase [Longilinea sp.]
MSTAIWWVRRDLRIIDNLALRQALRIHSTVIPVFIIDPHLLNKKAAVRQAFLFNGLRRLDQTLRGRDSRLILRQGDPVEVLAQLVSETGSAVVYAEEDFSPYARERDHKVGKTTTLNLQPGLTYRHPLTVVKQDGDPYTIFTPFSKVWKSLPFLDDLTWQPPAQLPHIANLTSEALPQFAENSLFPPGEVEAQHRLKTFETELIYTYADQRDRLDLDGTSSLSPYFRFGMLSARQAVYTAIGAMKTAPDHITRKSAETWVNELIWREFYQSILYYFPDVLKQAFNPKLRQIPWRTSIKDLQAWQQGLTGYPVVDACMRQLAETGWMHNRGRMITASFLTKDLLLNWQEGETWFMQHLVDGDLASNNGGWQWTAGVGTDAAPYFRIFNPILQGQQHDPNGTYTRRWVPELTKVPLEY